MTKKSETIEIKISDVLECLTQGYTRTKGEKNYDPNIGSIQEKYELNKSQVFELFKYDKLKGRKTIVKKAPAFVVVDDTTDIPTVIIVDNLEKPTSQEDDNTEEVSTPDTETLKDINDDAAEEVKPEKVEAEVVETDDQDNTWL